MVDRPTDRSTLTDLNNMSAVQVQLTHDNVQMDFAPFLCTSSLILSPGIEIKYKVEAGVQLLFPISFDYSLLYSAVLAARLGLKSIDCTTHIRSLSVLLRACLMCKLHCVTTLWKEKNRSVMSEKRSCSSKVEEFFFSLTRDPKHTYTNFSF